MSKTVLKNGLVFISDNGFAKTSLIIEYGRISSFSDSYDEDTVIIDCENSIIIPGLTDVHLHGCSGYDICDADRTSLEKICEFELCHGITTICPTTMTLPFAQLANIVTVSADSQRNTGKTDKAEIVGLNLEGPFISPERCGAQKSEYAELPSPDKLKKLNQLSNDLIKLVTIAPELDGAAECIKACKDFMHFSLGHTDCSYDEALSAFKAGADHVTHLFNAMPQFHHRDAGLIGAAADTEDCYVELIADGVHVSASAVRAAFKLFGDDRIVLISDSMEATGMPDGEYALGGNRVYKHGNKAVMADGTLAGSVSTLYDCFLSDVSMGVPLESAIKACTINPSRSIGIDDSFGSIEVGKRADILILNKSDLSIKQILKSEKAEP